MPRAVRAPSSGVPAGTVTSWPSTVSGTASSIVISCGGWQYLERRQDGRGGGLAQAADGGIGHRRAQLTQQVGVAGAAVTHREAVQDLDLPLRPHAAGDALAARLL